ncbi:COG2426 family protein [Alkaliphilus serpentinus]|uniref:Small multi-drug export protein n=1 Tax=Alkaliphilus serpentinus TaxID=1482731 RepID=A0A833HLT8_9FIRM|nr:small multi-drug export protein [Alkaliphilus serpentinus]KAB3526654.1 small multi-drug export protein [Alkaliphilus serpentinus]
MDRLLDILTKEFMVIFIAAMPLMELRGAIPIGVSLGMHPLHATALGIIGSLLPAPFLLVFLKPVFIYLRQRSLLKKFVDSTIKRTIKKSGNIKKYRVIGLILFVAIPLPTTGIWTGCLAATLFNIPFKVALPAIALGTTIAGVIMFVLSYVVMAM